MQKYIYREYIGNSEVYSLLQNVNCDFLPKIFIVENHNDKVCVLEEYVQGDTLSEILECGKIPVDMVCNIAIQICCALEVLHNMGAVHRDIKPENVILCGDKAVLIDFDASRINKADISNDTMVMGTTGYAAPEQYGFCQTDSRADIYAFGVMLNEMLTKKHPSQHIADCYLGKIIEKCIEVNVNNRYLNASELKQALENSDKSKSRFITKKKHYITTSIVLLCSLLIILLANSSYQESIADISSQLQTTKEKVSSLQTMLLEKEHHIITMENQSLQIQEDIQIPQELWQGDIDAYSTPFYYDLDGDGNYEECHFGVWFGRMQIGELTYIETNGVRAESDCPVEIFPAVWKITPDGTPAIMYGPVYNIFEPKVEVWRVDEWGDSVAPVVYPLDNVWDTGVQMVFTSQNEGTYIFRVTGEVNGQQLSGQAIMKIICDE